ncbi:glycosyltransferase family 2 protein [Thalassolituus sp. LLYu03]|uniref:glycosyltransferase family 2 protein n=1 Tax=Thalassolituus sp. LLYu03 TaxID=3421656 RepID=UPI003D28F996
MMPKFTIITVCYNSEKTIARTIESVLNQKCEDYEYIIVDGCSRDSTIEIIKSYEERFNGRMRWVSERDSGIYDAMNKGISLAQGTYVGLLNSDDWYYPNTLERVAVEVSSGCDVLYGLLEVYRQHEPQRVYANHPSYLVHESLAHPSSFVLREAYHQFGLYSQDYQSASDYDFFLRLYRSNASFKYINHILAGFLTGGVSSSHKGFYETLKIKRRYGLISARQYCQRKVVRKFKVLMMKILRLS